MPDKIDWPKAMAPLVKKYKNTRHPLEYKNNYQLLVMVMLSARDTDRHINQLSPTFFKTFPNMTALSKTTVTKMRPLIGKVRNFPHKAEWLLETARSIKTDKAIPLSMDKLTALPGIGRKSANVILREAGAPAEGIIVDLHVVRVAPRLGIATGTDPKKIEWQLMETLPKRQWDAGMAMSFLGREICRPRPDCPNCLMKKVCLYYSQHLPK